jgi:hypothetical protein
MTKGAKIAIALGIPLTLFGTYWFVIRNRRPQLSFESIDWLNKGGVVRFGNTENTFSDSKGFGATAGKTYSDRYTMTASPDGKGIVVFDVFKNSGTGAGKKVESITIDFPAKLKYGNLV